MECLLKKKYRLRALTNESMYLRSFLPVRNNEWQWLQEKGTTIFFIQNPLEYILATKLGINLQ